MLKYFMDLKKCWGVMPKCVMDLKKCWGVEKCLGGIPTNFVYGFEKKIWGRGGGVVMPKYFADLKNVGGGYANKFMDLKNVWGGYAKIF